MSKHRIDRVWCESHEKYGYYTRKDAKKAARIVHPGDHLSEYECDRGTGLWHFGHLPEHAIRRGVISRDALFNAPHRRKTT